MKGNAMGRPKSDEQTAPEKMQEAFWKLLEQKPYSQITISDVTRTSGLNRSAFYYHYNNVPELADDAIASVYEKQGVITLIVRLIRTPDDPEVLKAYDDFITRPEYQSTVHKMSLIAGPHGSAGLSRQLKDYIIGAWIPLFGLDKAKLDASQQLVLEFASSGILGLFGKASSLFTTQGIESIKRSTLPETISHLIKSLKNEE